MRKPTSPEEPERPFPKTGIVHTFKPSPDALPSERSACSTTRGGVHCGPQAGGAGAITLIGLDLNQTAFSQFELIDAGCLLAPHPRRRGSLEPAEERQPTWAGDVGPDESAPRIALRPGNLTREFPDGGCRGGRGWWALSCLWCTGLVAGPLGLRSSKHRKMSQHAWIAFVLAASAFTAVSWTGRQSSAHPRSRRIT